MCTNGRAVAAAPICTARRRDKRRDCMTYTPCGRGGAAAVFLLPGLHGRGPLRCRLWQGSKSRRRDVRPATRVHAHYRQSAREHQRVRRRSPGSAAQQCSATPAQLRIPRGSRNPGTSYVLRRPGFPPSLSRRFREGRLCAGMTRSGSDGESGHWHDPPEPRRRSDQCPSACTISSVIFFASPNSIIVFGRKNSSLSTPAYPDAIDRFTNSTVADFSTSRIGMP